MSCEFTDKTMVTSGKFVLHIIAQKQNEYHEELKKLTNYTN